MKLEKKQVGLQRLKSKLSGNRRAKPKDRELSSDNISWMIDKVKEFATFFIFLMKISKFPQRVKGPIKSDFYSVHNRFSLTNIKIIIF